MNATDHLRDTLNAAVALANLGGAAHRLGRPAGPPTPAEATAVLRLATRRPPAVDETALRALTEGGAALYRALDLLLAGREDEAAEAVNALLTAVRAEPRLVRHESEPWHLHFAPPGAGAAGWLADMATAAAMLLGSDEARRLRRCQAVRCEGFFLDTTRNRTQRYCSPACQNRTKVAAHRARSADAVTIEAATEAATGAAR